MPRIELASVAIPFRHAFAHASATRTKAANVLVRLQADGLAGLGEGCPRDYVTGETEAGALAFLRQRAPRILAEVPDLAALRRWLGANRAEVDLNPSAFCALEMALLDLFARREGVSVDALLGLPAGREVLEVTAVYGAASPAAFHLQRLRFGLAGMRQAKLKLTGLADRDAARARGLARRGPVRLDANNLFADAAGAVAALEPLRPWAWAVEEPVARRDWTGMAAVAEITGLAIILDESFTTADDLASAPPGPQWIANVRVSKLGGLLRTLEAISAAKARGLAVVVGAQVGETSLLARAGLAAASAAGPGLCGYEGAYGTHLLAYDLVAPAMVFDGRGRMPFPAATAPGWGLDPLPRLAAAFSTQA